MTRDTPANDVDGVFDTLLFENGVRWFEDRHLARLRAACEHFGIFAFERRDVAVELARYTEPLGSAALLVRTTVLPMRAASAELVFESRAPRAVPETGVELALVHGDPEPFGAWKSTRRIARAAAREEAERAGCFDGLRVVHGAVVEAARANVFVVIDGVVRTPPIEQGALPGIVRALLLESLPGVIQAPIDARDLRRASEMWITSSGVRVAPVRRIRALDTNFCGADGKHVRAAQAALGEREAEFRAHYQPRTGAS